MQYSKQNCCWCWPVWAAPDSLNPQLGLKLFQHGTPDTITDPKSCQQNIVLSGVEGRRQDMEGQTDCHDLKHKNVYHNDGLLKKLAISDWLTCTNNLLSFTVVHLYIIVLLSHFISSRYIMVSELCFNLIKNWLIIKLCQLGPVAPTPLNFQVQINSAGNLDFV